MNEAVFDPLPDFAVWVKGDRPPDLQKMVRHYGGYHLIPAATWVKFDEAVKSWQLRRNTRV